MAGEDSLCFLLEKTNKKFDVFAMWRALKRLWHGPAVRLGLARADHGRFRDPRFVSFLVQNNRRTVDTNRQDVVLRGRRLAKQALIALVAAGGAWFILESARALSTF